MSGRPITGEGTPLPSSTPTNSNGVTSSVAIGGPTLNPPKQDINPPPHLPTVTVPHVPLSAMPVDPSQQLLAQNNDPPKIPPLMGIRPNVSSLPPPPPAQLPPPPAAQFPPPVLPMATLPTAHPLVSAGSSVQSGPVPSPVQDPPKQHTPVPQAKKPTSVALKRGAPGPGKQMKGKEDEEGGGIQPKLPILRLKRGGEDDGFEKQDASKNDSYCWVCHDGGDVLCCDQCPRVFHLQCSGLQKPPDDEDNEWFCSICKNIARKTKRSRPQHLKDLLLLAVERMMFPGTEIFQAPVPPDIMTHYREYIFFPMHLGKIKEKVNAGKYQSTREFTHDTEWILHNCIIYNGAKHALTKIAKNIVKVCKEDMREIELCPGCYRLTVKQPKDWFCIPCNPPHPVVLAKVRGYPLWPAKLISETSDKCDVRFFGQHDRSLVPKCDIQVLNGLPPKPSTKTKHWNQAMFELKKYGENIESMRDNLGGVKDKSLKMLMKNRAGKSPQLSSLQSQQNSHGHQQKDGSRSMSNHTPPVVEVTPSDAADGLSDADVSSPGTPPSLQIDLRDSSGGGGKHNSRSSSQEKSPNKGRAMPSGGRGLIPSRNSQVPVSLDFNSDNGAQSVVVRSPSGGSKIKKKGKAGATLQALLTTLAQRKRVATTSMMPVHQGAAIRGPGDVGGAPGTPGAGSGQEEAEDASAKEPQVKNDSSFSSIYEHEKKTAVIVVDPNQKRTKRKTPKAAGNEGPPPKKPRITNNAEASSTNPTSAANKVADLDPTLSDPAALVAKVQEFGNAAIHALSSTASAVNTTPTPPNTVTSLKASTGNIRASMSTSPQNTSGSSNHSGSAPAPALPGLPKARATGGKKKSGKKGDKGRGAKSSPYKGGKGAATATPAAAATSVSSALGIPQQIMGLSPSLAALINGNASTNTTSVTGAVPTAAVSESTRADFLSQVTQGAASIGRGGPGSSADAAGGGVLGEVRGEMAAPGMASEEMSDFAEGTGLLADTIRKVNTSFMARVNQITGPSDDMGYKYFVEKLMASIKTVLIEMLSTFDAKSRTSAKQLKEQLHQGWPVSNSAVAIEQLGKELRDEMKQSLEVVRASAALELEQVVNEVRRHVEKEKEIAIIETKKKKWCSYCYKQALFNCCWNANYCNEICQQDHWPDHMEHCTQLQQLSAGPGPGPHTLVRANTPMQKGPGGQLSPTLGVGGVPNGVGMQSGTGQDSQSSAFLFPAVPTTQQQSQAQAQAFAAQAHAQMISQTHLQQQQGGSGADGGQQQGGRMSPVGFVNHTGATTAQPHALSSSLGGSGTGGSLPPLPPSLHPTQQHLRATSSGAGLRHDQHHVGGHGGQQGSPLLHVDNMHQMDTLPGPSQLATPTQMEKHMEQLANDRGGGMLTSANTASPPNHIRNMLLSQHHQQSSKGTVITGSNPMLMSHPGPGPPPPPSHAGVHTPPSHPGVHTPPSHPGMHTPPVGAADIHPALSARSLSSEHSHSSNSSGMLHPISPVTPPTDNPPPPGGHSYGGWSYPHPQHAVLLGNDSYAHGLPLLPAMQANTPTTQNHAFFKANF